jgi:hypothetical protein
MREAAAVAELTTCVGAPHVGAETQADQHVRINIATELPCEGKSSLDVGFIITSCHFVIVVVHLTREVSSSSPL